MTTSLSTKEVLNDPTYTRLVESPLYQTYKKAFCDATGLNLVLLPSDEETPVAEEEHRNINPFCHQISGGNSQWAKCAKPGWFFRENENERVETITYSSKMKETAVQVRTGRQTVAYLVTGQIFTEKPKEKDFDKFTKFILGQSSEVTDIADLWKAWTSCPIMPTEQYMGAITLLTAFSVQLSELVNQLVIENRNCEPDVVTRAKQFVNANLEDKVCLEDVAKRVGVSSFYFCRIFKKTTGMTLTEYVNRRRVEWAKRKLANPQAYVTAVAYDVGYQSLSQFNRCFLKYVGMSPTRYREHHSSKKVMGRSLAA